MDRTLFVFGRPLCKLNQFDDVESRKRKKPPVQTGCADRDMSVRSGGIGSLPLFGLEGEASVK